MQITVYKDNKNNTKLVRLFYHGGEHVSADIWRNFKNQLMVGLSGTTLVENNADLLTFIQQDISVKIYTKTIINVKIIEDIYKEYGISEIVLDDTNL